MDNKGFEGKKKTKAGPKAEFQMEEEKKSLAPKTNLLSRSTTLLLVAVILLVVFSIFGIMYYKSQSDKKEIQSELREAISKLAQVVKSKETQDLLETTPGKGNASYFSSAEVSNILREENKMSRKNVAIVPSTSRIPGSFHREPYLSVKKSLMISNKPWLNMRLPKSILPNTYDMELNIDMDNDTYEGNVTINVYITQDTNVILFHRIGLDIKNVNVKNSKTLHQVVIAKEFYYQPNEYYVVETTSSLKKGEYYDINIEFSGKMGSELNGFYTSFSKAGGVKKKVASTFFSPISARKAFPCFDEPEFKAKFTLTLTHSDKYKALSNMAPLSTCQKDNLLKTKFLTTLKMSTYILCWVICDYNSIQSEYQRIHAWADDVEDVRFALKTGDKLLKFYEEYFKIPYPLKKLDLVSIPNFGPGAMENWGIITFRAERILIDQKTTEYVRQKSFNIIAHELVHQWFGNLVTMKFWNDAWLKEGFANNIGAIGGHHVDKHMGSKEQVLTSFMLPALEVDAYATSHPISSKVKTPSDIRGIFDLITYNKGSCLVDLLHNYLGDEDFRKGLHSYLTTYAYGNANQDDLWEQLGKVSGKDVKSVMDTWTLQLGYPVISVRRINISAVEIKQQRFSLDAPGTKPPRSPFGYKWKVPIIFKSPSTEERHSYLLEDATMTINIPARYSILNPDHSLFYRVKYDESMMSSISDMLINEVHLLSPQDRTGIISDQFSFVDARMVNISKTLDLLSYLKHETDYYPWKVAVEQLFYIRTLIVNETTQIRFNRFIQELTADVVKNISWRNTTSVNQGSLQVLVLSHACQVGSDHSQVYLTAEKYYVDWILGHDIKLRPSLHPVFKDCAISIGPDFYWNYAYLRYQQKDDESDSLLWSLATTTTMHKIKTLLDLSINNRMIDSQYTPYVIAKLSQSSHKARKMCWQFIKQNWSIFIKRYGSDLFMLSDMLTPVLKSFSTLEDLNDIKAFFKNRYVGSAKNSVKQAIHKIEGNIEWKKNNFGHFLEWIDQQGF